MRVSEYLSVCVLWVDNLTPKKKETDWVREWMIIRCDAHNRFQLTHIVITAQQVHRHMQNQLSKYCKSAKEEVCALKGNLKITSQSIDTDGIGR